MANSKDRTVYPQQSEIYYQLSLNFVRTNLHQGYVEAVRAFIRYNEDEAMKVSAVTDTGAEMVLFHRDTDGVRHVSTVPASPRFDGYNPDDTYIVYVFDCKNAQLVVSREVSGESLSEFLDSYQQICACAPHLHADAFKL